MNSKILTCNLIGILISVTAPGLFVANATQAGTPDSRLHSQQLFVQTSTNRQGMMSQVDRHFIQMMIPHHQSAVDMANLALNKAKRPELKKLAQAIKTGQTKEIQEMRAWYKKWYGTDVPTTSSMGMTSSLPR